MVTWPRLTIVVPSSISFLTHIILKASRRFRLMPPTLEAQPGDFWAGLGPTDPDLAQDPVDVALSLGARAPTGGQIEPWVPLGRASFSPGTRFGL